MKVALLALRWCDYGGWASYTKHLAIGIQQAGHDVGIFRLGGSKCKSKSIGMGLDLVPVTMDEDGVAFLRRFDLIDVVVFATEGQSKLNCRPTEFNFLSKLGPIVVTLHDPTEWRSYPGTKVELSSKGTFFKTNLNIKKIVFIREAAAETFCREISAKWDTVVCPHPYSRMAEQKLFPRRNCAVVTSRIDYDKNIHLILPIIGKTEVGVEFWTSPGGVNRMYEHQILLGLGWNQSLLHPWGFEKSEYDRCYGGALALVDMSTISGDGGGTQYTFLEAMDYGCNLIINSKWGSGELKPHIHYTPVDNSDQIISALKELHLKGISADRIAANNECLSRHSAKKQASSLLEMTA